jgi:deoxyribodipyrimidine photolyase-related protein
MSHFLRALGDLPADLSSRRWIFVPYDQLTDAVGPIAEQAPEQTGIVLVESRHKASRRPYHKQKLAWVLSNQRHFAVEQARRGVAVDYRFADESYVQTLRQVSQERGALVVMRPAERELRYELTSLFEERRLIEVRHAGWLSTAEDFAQCGGPPYRMDSFYRIVRRRTGVLMEGDTPRGGRFSFDGENRQPWRGEPPAPPDRTPTFVVDPMTAEVGELIERHFAHHPGTLQLDQIPSTQEDAQRLWDHASTYCLPHFGPYEDAMSTFSRALFHTRIAPLLNLHRLLPARVVADVAVSHLPLNSQEGFIRQILGWREFVHHVHEATDGFRQLPLGPAPITPSGAAPSFLNAHNPLPDAWWGATSGMNCLDTVVRGVWEDGWTHHIPRLMVLANLATLLDVEPRELTDWFWVAFIDAYDWVVEPNVLGMGTFGAGDVMTTKPYVSGAPYLNKMGDYCRDCRFDPKSSCPVTPMYWAFLDRHQVELATHQRMSLAIGGLRRRGEQQLAADRERARLVLDALLAGREV